MKTGKIFLFLGVITFLSLLMASGPVLAAPAKTAQSGMITIDSPAFPASFVVIDSFTYQYDRDCAATFFTCNKVDKTWLGTEAVPNSNCSGTPTSTSPTADNGDLQQLINANKCNFFSGTSFTDPTSLNSTGTCQSFSNSSPSSTKESSRRTDVVCALVSPAPVDPRVGYVNPGDIPTCWNLDSTTGALPTITPVGTVASESALCNSQHPLKYSFTITDPSSSNGTRVTGLTATLKDSDGNTVMTWSEALTSLTVGLESSGTNFIYNGANGANGNVGLLTSTDGLTYNVGCTSEAAYVNDIQGGSVSACGPLPSGCSAFLDTFAGNNGVGGDLVAYTALEASPSLDAGSYTLEVSGTIKSSVSGLANLPVDVCASITVDAGTCLNTSTTCP